MYKGPYNKFRFTRYMSKAYSKPSIKIMLANSNGNNIVQQNDISWSNLIRGKDALIQMNKNTNIELFTPKEILFQIPNVVVSINNSLNLKYWIE